MRRQVHPAEHRLEVRVGHEPEPPATLGDGLGDARRAQEGASSARCTRIPRMRIAAVAAACPVSSGKVSHVRHVGATITRSRSLRQRRPLPLASRRSKRGRPVLRVSLSVTTIRRSRRRRSIRARRSVLTTKRSMSLRVEPLRQVVLDHAVLEEARQRPVGCLTNRLSRGGSVIAVSACDDSSHRAFSMSIVQRNDP